MKKESCVLPGRTFPILWIVIRSIGNPDTSLHSRFRSRNAKTPAFWAGVFGLGSLTITYFHTGIRTIIGVESFHGPVRDG
ncbi:hypothetical protein, partial [Burkholderia sp. AU33545]|uniref:hypothetical protein n=1 Tax=Burkholderia sp. AU33545 TaxID=2879631 RepID=UPI00299D8C8D